jgi:CDP-diacylglycerol---glycerol-3-phosphate 3-phosphatidyltransferase
MLNLPNILTLSRIAFIPVLFILLFFHGKTASFFAALCFALASLTDFLDGFFARRRNSITRLGKILDPLADKLLITACLIMLIPLHGVAAGVVAIIVTREIAITGLRGIAAIEGLVIPAETLGKKKTAFQVVAVFSLLLHYEYFHLNFHQIGNVLLFFAMLLAVWSGLVYFYRFSYLINRIPREERRVSVDRIKKLF